MAAKQNRLLIVDDEIEVCEMLKTLFQNDGFEVATAYDGQAALNQTRSGSRLSWNIVPTVTETSRLQLAQWCSPRFVRQALS